MSDKERRECEKQRKRLERSNASFRSIEKEQDRERRKKREDDEIRRLEEQNN